MDSLLIYEANVKEIREDIKKKRLSFGLCPKVASTPPLILDTR